MFVIACKFNHRFPFIFELIDGIRVFHPDEKIVVVDSDSDDKSYLGILREKHGVITEDIANKNWMIGAYWYVYKKCPDEDFYYFMHDSMKVKANLDYLREKDLTLLMTFERGIGGYNGWSEAINNETDYDYTENGHGCYGPIFFCKNKVMKKMLDMGADKFMPVTKQDSHYGERAYGVFLEAQGYDLLKCSLYGDVLEEERPTGRSGKYPHNTSWQYPVEKIYASLVDKKRL